MVTCTIVESIEIEPENYGYELTEDDMLVPTVTSKDVMPDNFPVSCNCLKCLKKKRLTLSCKTNMLRVTATVLIRKLQSEDNPDDYKS